MAIEVSEPLSPGWWLRRLSNKLLWRHRRLQLLDDYMKGLPPLDLGVPAQAKFYREFMKKARTNFAELVVEAPRERMAVTGFRTAVAADDLGDSNAWSIWKANNLATQSVDVHEQMLGLGISYVIVGLDATVTPAVPIITGEDPREVITESDPMKPQKVIAALKLFHDDVQNLDLAYLYLPGVVYVAGRQRRAKVNQQTGQLQASPSFSPQGWDWLNEDFEILNLVDFDSPNLLEDAAKQPLPTSMSTVVPVVPFANKHELGEFETHRDLLDRINHTILQRLVITLFQAFRQRAVKGELPDTNEAGEQIDYDKVFSADPGALWQIPANVDLWESQQSDLTGVIGAAKADIEQLAAVTRTPIHYLTPGQTAQSAEGASLAREGLVFKTQDRIARANAGWTQVMHLAYLMVNDATRAPLGELDPIWAPVERFSLAEMAAASAQSATSLPWETQMERVWQMGPEELARAKSQRSVDEVVAQVAAQKAAELGKGAPPVVEEPPEGG